MSWLPCKSSDLIVGDVVRFSIKYPQRETNGEIRLFNTAKGPQPGFRRVTITGRIVDAVYPETGRTLILERTRVEGGVAKDTVLPNAVERLPLKRLGIPKADLQYIPIEVPERTYEAGKAYLLERLRRAAGGDHTSKAAVQRVSECCLPESIEKPDTVDQFPMRMGKEAAVRVLAGEERYAEAVWMQLKGKLVVDRAVPWKPAPTLAEKVVIEPAPVPEPELPVADGEVVPEIAALMREMPGMRVVDVRMKPMAKQARRKKA